MKKIFFNFVLKQKICSCFENIFTKPLLHFFYKIEFLISRNIFFSSFIFLQTRKKTERKNENKCFEEFFSIIILGKWLKNILMLFCLNWKMFGKSLISHLPLQLKILQLISGQSVMFSLEWILVPLLNPCFTGSRSEKARNSYWLD